MSKNLTLAAGVILVLVIAGWFLTRPKQTAVPTPDTTQTSGPIESASSSASLVKITASGFSPQTITIKVGDSVTWENDDSENHTVNSNPHPTHTLYPVLNQVGLIQPGEKKSLQFTTAGTYAYHDHLNPSMTGSVTVQ